MISNRIFVGVDGNDTAILRNAGDTLPIVKLRGRPVVPVKADLLMTERTRILPWQIRRIQEILNLGEVTKIYPDKAMHKPNLRRPEIHVSWYVLKECGPPEIVQVVGEIVTHGMDTKILDYAVISLVGTLTLKLTHEIFRRESFGL